MTKKALLVFLILLVLIAGSVGILLQKKPCGEPAKPEGVPRTAIWNGGCDGGYWLDLVEAKGAKYRFRLYLDYTAEVVMDADFVLNDSCKIPLPQKDHILNKVTIVEEDKILIYHENQNCYLQPVYPAYGGSSYKIIKEKQ